MYVALMQLLCDGCAGATYPPKGGADAVMFTRAQLRQGARKDGWRYDRTQQKDFCPFCEARRPKASGQ